MSNYYDQVLLILEAKIELEEDPFNRKYCLLGTINRYRYDLRIFPVYPECWSYPYVGSSNNLSCTAKTLLCSSVDARFIGDKRWVYRFQLSWRPVTPYVWDYQYLERPVAIYPCTKFSSWLPSGLTWKVK